MKPTPITELYPQLPPLGSKAKYSWRDHPVTIIGYELKTYIDEGETKTILDIEFVHENSDTSMWASWHEFDTVCDAFKDEEE